MEVVVVVVVVAVIICGPVASTDVRDVLGSSNVTLYKSRLRWSSPCSARELNVSASLCWKQRRRPCTPVLNSTLQQVEDEDDLVGSARLLRG